MLSPVLSIIASALLLVGTPMASPDANERPTFDEMFDELRAESPNPVVLEVIADNRVTDEEVQILIDGTLTCMADAGFPEVETVPNEFIPGSFHFSWQPPAAPTDATPGYESPDFSAVDAAFNECLPEWTKANGIRDAMYTNPDNEDILVLNLECMHTYNLVPDDFTYHDIQRAAVTGDWGSGAKQGTDAFTLCLVNPLQIGLEPMPLPEATPKN